MKKLVAFWLAFILVLCSICSVAATIDTQTGRLFGDTDNDGFVAITDATKIQKHVARILVLDEETLKIADVDGDNQITIMDCTSIQQLIAKIIDTFPVEKETTTDKIDKIVTNRILSIPIFSTEVIGILNSNKSSQLL